MPVYNFECSNIDCKKEWEDYFSTTEEPTKICPECKQETAKRVITCMTKGIVKLEGQELVNKCIADGKQMAREARTDEKKYANLLGESRYETLQKQIDRQKR